MGLYDSIKSAAHVPMGDTEEEIDRGDRMAVSMFAGAWPRAWAEACLDNLDFALPPNAGGTTGADVRGLIRYLDGARSTLVDRAAKLDQAQGRGSWARPWTADDVRALLVVVEWLLGRAHCSLYAENDEPQGCVR